MRTANVPWVQTRTPTDIQDPCLDMCQSDRMRTGYLSAGPLYAVIWWHALYVQNSAGSIKSLCRQGLREVSHPVSQKNMNQPGLNVQLLAHV